MATKEKKQIQDLHSLKPMIKYRGGKSKEIGSFQEFFPQEYSRYIEPFLGGGAVFFYLNPKRSIVNDLNPKLMEFYNDVRNDYPLLKDELAEIERVYCRNQKRYEKKKEKEGDDFVENENEKLYYKIRDMYNGKIKSSYLKGSLYYFINKTAYSGMIRYNSEGEFNVPFGRYKNFNTSIITINHHELLMKSEICCSNYAEILNRTTVGDFVFLDPPYDCIFTDYGNLNELDFTEEKQRTLAEDFKNLSCKTVLVIAKTKLIAELYKGYIRKEYGKTYSVNIKNRFKSTATHLVITNF